MGQAVDESETVLWWTHMKVLSTKWKWGGGICVQGDFIDREIWFLRFGGIIARVSQLKSA